MRSTIYLTFPDWRRRPCDSSHLVKNFIVSLHSAKLFKETMCNQSQFSLSVATNLNQKTIGVIEVDASPSRAAHRTVID
jgi:hypothetical protein